MPQETFENKETGNSTPQKGNKKPGFGKNVLGGCRFCYHRAVILFPAIRVSDDGRQQRVSCVAVIHTGGGVRRLFGPQGKGFGRSVRRSRFDDSRNGHNNGVIVSC